MLVACQKDEDLDITSAESIANARGNNDQNRNGQNGNNGNNGNNGGRDNQRSDQLSELDNDIAYSWIDLFLELDRYATGMRPNATARALAYINLAAYETGIPGMVNLSSNTEFINGFNIISPRKTIDFEIALNSCYADVINHFLLHLPTNERSKIGILEETNEADLSNNVDTDIINDSKEWGGLVAATVIRFSQTDQEAEAQILAPQPTSYVPPTGDGYWTFSAEPERALFPYWESVRTFTISPEQTTSVDPIPYSTDPSSEYYKEMEEVIESNNTAKVEDNEDLWIAEFWSDDIEGLMFSPPARQYAISNQLIDLYDLNLEESLHLNLKLGFSMNDAAVSAWKYKYEYMVMRPNVYIHEFIDPSFQTNLFRLIPWPNPTFPGYPSGHSTFASAAAGVFKNFLGNEINFTDRSHEGRTEFRSTPRTYNSFDVMAEENAFSRVLLGVH